MTSRTGTLWTLPHNTDPVLTPPLPPRLLHCRPCGRSMIWTIGPGAGWYQCTPACRPRPVPAAAVADIIGRAILHQAPTALPATSLGIYGAARHAHTALNRVTVGTHPTDLRFTWRTTPTPPANPLLPLTERTRLARQHLAHHQPEQAIALLRAGLAGIHPDTAPTDDDLADAAELYAYLTIGTAHSRAAVRWAVYAHHTRTRHHGPTSTEALTSHRILAAAYRHAHQLEHAASTYRDLAQHLEDLHGPTSAQVLTTRASYAIVLHELGRCGPARTLLHHVLATYEHHHPDDRHTADVIRTKLATISTICRLERHRHPTPEPPPQAQVPRTTRCQPNRAAPGFESTAIDRLSGSFSPGHRRSCPASEGDATCHR